MADPVSIAVIYPDLLGTYGDGGNAVILAQRLRWRGQDAEIVEVRAGQPAPASCDIYVLGGGEDAPQALAADQLLIDRPLHKAVDGGAVVFAVCAGLQVLGHSFLVAGGKMQPGLGLLDITTGRAAKKRAVGEIVVEPDPYWGGRLPMLTGYENHAGVTELGPLATPLGRVVTGIGNGAGDGMEGAVRGHVLGTYLHGPVLARNPALADLLLGWVVGDLELLDDAEEAELRAERLAAAWSASRRSRRRSPWRRLLQRS